MKRLILIIPILLHLFFSCEKDDIEDINNEINQLQDSLIVVGDQYEALLDSISTLINTTDTSEVDIKALKMAQIYSLFEAIARQPEAADVLINATRVVYHDYTELLPLSDEAVPQRGEARGTAFSGLFEAIARQPEAFNKLDSAATIFLGEYSSSYISDELLEYSKVFSVTALNESIARQPSADSLFNIASIKYLNIQILEED